MKHNRLRRTTAAILTAALAVGSLAGCGANTASSSANGAGSTAGSSAATNAKVTIKLAMWDKSKTTYLQPLFDAYTKKHPNVSFNAVDLGSSDYITALTTQLAGGSSDFDVVSVKDIPSYVSMSKAGQLEDMTQTIADNSLKDEDFGGVLSQMKYTDGKTYAIPFRNDFWIIFYNKKLLKEKGIEPSNDLTFDQYNEMAKKLTSGSGNNKVYGDYFHTWPSTVQQFGILDGKNTILNGLEGKDYTFLKPYYETVLKQMKEGTCMDYATAKSSSVHYSGVFENGQAAMINIGAWFIPTLINDINSGKANEVKDNWGIMKYPHPTGVKAGTTIGTLTSMAVPTSAPNKDAAKDFVAFAASKEGAKVLAANGSFSAYKDQSVVETLKNMKGFPGSDSISAEALNVEKAYLEFPVTPNASELDGRLTESHDAIMTKAKTIDEGLAQMKSDAESLK